MVIYPDGKIEMTVVRIFHNDDVDELRAEFPDVVMDFNAFPKTTEPNSRVRLNLEIETTYSFDDSNELEHKRPDLHRIHQQYTPRPPIITWSKQGRSQHNKQEFDIVSLRADAQVLNNRMDNDTGKHDHGLVISLQIQTTRPKPWTYMDSFFASLILR